MLKARRRDLVKCQFNEPHYKNLVEFGKRLNSLNVDVFVLMARKAVGLFDVMNFLGIISIKAFKKKGIEIISDRALDIKLDYYIENNKKIALIDDTLIVGTTFYETLYGDNGIVESLKKREKSNFEYEVHVFCADKINWRDWLVKPDSIQSLMSSTEVMEFCISEVKAFSIISRPYLVDFPLTNEFNLSINQFESLKLSKVWQCFEVPTQVQDICSNRLFTFIPDIGVIHQLISWLNIDYTSLIEIFKIRLFVRPEKEMGNLVYCCKIVPIVTLKPMLSLDANKLFEEVLQKSGKYTNIARIRKFIKEPKSQQRFIQYFSSCILGRIFIDYLKSDMALQNDIQFDENETLLHFGNPLCGDIILLKKNFVPELPLYQPVFENVTSPTEFVQYSEVAFAPLIENKSKYRDFVSEFFDIFSNLYWEKEINARNEIEKLNIEVKALALLTPTEGNSNEGINQHIISRINVLNQRLRKGIPFEVIIQHFSKIFQLGEITFRLTNIISIALDICNDYGVSVPVTCVSDDGKVVLRGYRHGELGGRISLDLVVNFLNGFISAKGSNQINHIMLEKLMVIFFRLSYVNGLLDAVYKNKSDLAKALPDLAPNAIDARMGYYLMGAVMTTNLKEYFPINRADWFSQKLIEKGIIKRINLLQNQSNSYYELIRLSDWKISESTNVKNIWESESYGRLFGNVYKLTEVKFKEDEFIFLATCSEFIHLSLALGAELSEYLIWMKKYENYLFNPDHFKDSITINRIFDEIKFKEGYEQKGFATTHQAILKFKGTEIDRKLNIKVLDVFNKLDEDKKISWAMVCKDLIANFDLKNPSKSFERDESFKKISLNLSEAMLLLFQSGIWAIAFEILIEREAKLKDPYTQIDSVITYVHYNEDLGSFSTENKNIIPVKKSVNDPTLNKEIGEVGYLSKIEGGLYFRFKYRNFGNKFENTEVPHRTGEIVETKEGGKFKILNIDNRNTTFISKEEKLAGFQNNYNLIKHKIIEYSNSECWDFENNRMILSLIDLTDTAFDDVAKMNNETTNLYNNSLNIDDILLRIRDELQELKTPIKECLDKIIKIADEFGLDTSDIDPMDVSF